MAGNNPKKSRALLIGRRVLDNDLQAALGGFGYQVDYSRTRQEGVRKFRAQQQPLVIVDVEEVSGFPERFFRFFRMVRENVIILVVSGSHQAEASRVLLWGAHDIMTLPLRHEALNFTLSRTSAYHRELVKSTFYRNAAWFALAMLPLWLLLIYIGVR